MSLRDFSGSASEENIREGIKRLGAVLRKFVGVKKSSGYRK
jgi:DNA-binding transcriptional MocR family regulator